MCFSVLSLGESVYRVVWFDGLEQKFTLINNLASIFMCKLVKTAELNPNKNYILGCHPHGIMCAGGFSCFSTDSCGFPDMFPGVRPTLAILAGLFRIPLFREYIMCAGIHSHLWIPAFF